MCQRRPRPARFDNALIDVMAGEPTVGADEIGFM
jgi:hypothetical protein